jgi:hypothetical protein
MKVRRCSAIFIELRERLNFELGRLVAGGTGVEAVLEQIALVAHLDQEIPVEARQVSALGLLSPELWIEFEEACKNLPRELLLDLIATGLLITDSDDHANFRRSDETIRDSHWKGLSATVHRHTRWQAIDTLEVERRFGGETERPFLETRSAGSRACGTRPAYSSRYAC